MRTSSIRSLRGNIRRRSTEPLCLQKPRESFINRNLITRVLPNPKLKSTQKPKRRFKLSMTSLILSRGPLKKSMMRWRPSNRCQSVTSQLPSMVTGPTKRQKINYLAPLSTTPSMAVTLSTETWITSKCMNMVQTSIFRLKVPLSAEDASHSIGLLSTGLPRWTIWAIQSRLRTPTLEMVKKSHMSSSSDITTP